MDYIGDLSRGPMLQAHRVDASSSFAAREKRLGRVVGRKGLFADTCLVKAVKLPEPVYARLRGAAAAYLWHSLVRAYPEQSFELSPNVIEDYSEAVLGLPNRTPNGLILPRRETCLSFNLVQQTLCDALSVLGMIPAFSAVQSPCNVRVVSGTPDAKADGRPYASSKIHTDVWYGEPTCSILFNLPLLGDPQSVAMEFFEPGDFPDHLQTSLDDYTLGHAVAAGSSLLPVAFECGVLYVSDALSLHQTVRRSDGIRLSLDWRAIPCDLLAGESDDMGPSHASYIDIETWTKGGATRILVDGDPIDGFQRRARGEVVQPAEFHIVPIGRA
jgi:hypothetical protein